MLLTASGLDRASACAGSTVLPQHRHASPDSDWGTVVHRFIDRAATVGRERALGEIDDHEDQAKCAAIDLDAIPAGAESEVAFAYDPESDRAERLVLDEPRGYPDDGRIYGTADRVGVLADRGAVYVADFKTGKMGRRARWSMQLRCLALAASRVAGLDEAHVAMLYLRHDGTWFTDRAELDSLDLDETQKQLREIQAAEREAWRVVALGGLPQLVPGIHCEHCGAAPECPAQSRQQQALVARAPADLVQWLADMPEAQAGALVEQAIVVAKLAERVREAANARVIDSGDLPLPSGRLLTRVSRRVQKTSAVAKREIAALTSELQERGEITTEATLQVRVVGGARKGSS